MSLTSVQESQVVIKELLSKEEEVKTEKILNEFGLWIDPNWKTFSRQNDQVLNNPAPTLYKGNVKYKECEVDGNSGTWVFYYCMDCQDTGRSEIITYTGEKFKEKFIGKTFTSYNRYFSHWKRFIGEDPKTGGFPVEFNQYAISMETCSCKKGEELRHENKQTNKSRLND